MYDNEQVKPTGYTYPCPSVEGGKITSSTKPEPRPLSPESVEKLKRAVRRISDQK